MFMNKSSLKTNTRGYMNVSWNPVFWIRFWNENLNKFFFSFVFTELAKKATEEDNKKNYAEAVKLYENAV